MLGAAADSTHSPAVLMYISEAPCSLQQAPGSEKDLRTGPQGARHWQGAQLALREKVTSANQMI